MYAAQFSCLYNIACMLMLILMLGYVFVSPLLGGGGWKGGGGVGSTSWVGLMGRLGIVLHCRMTFLRTRTFHR